MHAQGLEPSVTTYNAAISACENGSQWQQALELLAEMQASGSAGIVDSAAMSAFETGHQWHDDMQMCAALGPAQAPSITTCALL